MRNNQLLGGKTWILWHQRHSKKRKWGEEERGRSGMGRKGDTNTGLMTSCTVVAHECTEGEIEGSRVVLGASREVA